MKGGLRVSALSPNGKRIASGSWDKTIRIWSVKSGQEKRVLQGCESDVNCVAFSPNGKLLVSGLDNNAIFIWRVIDGKKHGELQGHNDKVTCLQFSPDGEFILSGSWDQTLRVWRASTGEEMNKLEGHQGWVLSGGFSSDGKFVVSGSDDNTVRIWQVTTAQEFSVLRGHQSKINCVKFIQNGEQVISGSDDMTVRLWEIASAQCIMLLKLNDMVLDISCHINNSIVLSFRNGNLQCWQDLSTKNNYRWQLYWSSDIKNRALFVVGLDINDGKELSDQNRRMLEQRGVSLEAEVKSENQSKLNARVSSRTGSPIYQNNNTDIINDDSQEDERTAHLENK